MKNKKILNQKTNPYIYLYILVTIILTAIGMISYAWFTDKKSYTGNLEMGTVNISVDNGTDNQDVTFNISRAVGSLGGKIMPGDTVSCNVRIKNIGTEPCYYLVCFVNDNAVLSSSFNKDYYYNTTNLDTESSNNTIQKLGKLNAGENQTVSIKLEISSNLETGANQSTEINCTIYAIQQANLSESNAYIEIQKMKSAQYPTSIVMNLYNEDGTPSAGSNSITSRVELAYTDSTKKQFYIDASKISSNLTNSAGEQLYFYSTASYNSTTSTSKYIEDSPQSNIALMNTSLLSKTDTAATSYLAKLSKAQNFDLTYDLNNKIIYNTPNYGISLYPVFLSPNYGNTDTTKNTYVKGTTPYLIISKDKSTTDVAEFQGHTNLKAVVIPNTFSTINTGNFDSCSNLKYVILPTSNLTTLARQAFSRSGIEEIYLPDCITALNNTTDKPGAFAACTSLKSARLPKNCSNSSVAFYSCSNLKSIIWGENMESVDYASFRGCFKLSDIILPNTIKTIGAQAFAQCTNLTNINFNTNLQLIDQQAFYGCSNLKYVDFPISLKSIGLNAFNKTNLTGEIGIPYQCEILKNSNSPFLELENLTSFYLKDANGNRITETTFTGVNGEITYFTNGDGCLYKKLNGNNVRLELFPGGYINKEFRIGANVTEFRRFELENSYTVERFVVDKNNEYFENDSYGVIYVKKQTSYDGRTFTKNMLLSCPTGATFTSYTMKDGISGIYLFSTEKLEHLTIPTNTTMTTIPGCCFQGAKKLKTINSNIDGVFDLSGLNITRIGYKSFEYCYELKEMILPASCDTIESGAFLYSGITKLTTYSTTKLTLNNSHGYVKSGDLLKNTGRYVENGTEKFKGLQQLYIVNSSLATEYQNDSEWNVYLNKADGEDYKLTISVIA